MDWIEHLDAAGNPISKREGTLYWGGLDARTIRWASIVVLCDWKTHGYIVISQRGSCCSDFQMQKSSGYSVNAWRGAAVGTVNVNHRSSIVSRPSSGYVLDEKK
jgi:hypothetical protein